MKKTVLITGAAGFAGKHMCEYLSQCSDELNVVGTDVIVPDRSSCDEFISADITKSDAAEKMVSKLKPDYVIHLAGTFGTDDTQDIYRVNVLSVTALLESLRINVPKAIFLTAGSAAEYGQVTTDQLPVTEETPCNPITPYGLSKLLATQAALYYNRVHGMNTMVFRPFQLIGKGVTTRLAPGAFAQQLKQVIDSGSNVIKVGNLESSRDFLDINDAVKAIWLLCQNPAPGQIFNIASANPTKIADLLNMMIKASGADVKVEVDPDRLRGKADVSTVYGSITKIKEQCRWSPSISLADTISDMFAK